MLKTSIQLHAASWEKLTPDTCLHISGKVWADLYHLHGGTGGQEWKGEAGFTLASSGFYPFWMITICFHTAKGLLWRKQNKASSLLGSCSLTMGLWRVPWPSVR